MIARRLALIVAIGSEFVASASAADLTWDIVPGSVGPGNGTITGGAGTWDTTLGNWTLDGGANNVAWSNAGNDVALFGGTAGTVTLSAPITAGGLRFNTTGYTLTGGTLTLAGAAPTVTVSNGLTATINSVVAGSAGLRKDGAGTLTLSGSAVNTYTGTTSVAGGVLNLNFANLAAPTNLINAASALSFGGGSTLGIVGKATGTTSQTFASTSLTAGANVLTITRNGGSGSATLNFGDITRSFGALLNFQPGTSWSNTASTTEIVTLGTVNGVALPAANRYIGAWATAGVGGAARFAQVTPSGQIVSAPSSTVLDGGAANMTSSTTSYAANATAFTVSTALTGYGILGNNASGVTFTMSGSGSMTFNGLIHIATGGTTTIGGTGNVIVGAENDLVLNAASGGITINAPIVNGSAGTSNLTVGGALTNNVVLSAQNTFSGQATLSGGLTIPTVSSTGSVGAITSGPLGTGTIVLAGGSLRASTTATTLHNAVTVVADTLFPTLNNEGSLTLAGPVTLAGNRTLNVEIGSSVIGSSLILSNAVGDGGNNFGLTKTGAGLLTLSGSNTYGGTTTATAGTLLATVVNALPGYNTAGRMVFNGGTLAVRVGAGGFSTAQVDTLLSNAVKSSGALGIDTTTASVAQWTGFNTTNFGPSLGLAKLGANTLTLNAANTYAGLTTVSAGSLVVQNANALGATTAGTTVASGARLELSGGVTVAGEALTISGDGANFFGALQSAAGNNTWSGPITIAAAGTRIGAVAGTTLTVSGAINSGANVFGVTFRPQDNSASLTISGANTYLGPTSILGGPVSVSSLNSVVGGTASSSLGAPTTAANGVITLGGSNVDGVLVYTGAGETTDRAINLGGTTGGGGISQSGTGLLRFTTDLTAVATAKTLTLSGSTAGTGEFAGKIVNAATDPLTLVKSGTGTWTLSGANSYTGATSVNGGTLIVNGAIANSAVAVASGATLKGGGSIAGTVTFVSGATFAPGTSIESLATGALMMQTGSTFAYELNADAPAATAGDLVAVTGNLSLTDTTLTLTELGSGAWDFGDKLTLISYSGVWNGGLFNYGGALADDSTFTLGGNQWSINYNDAAPGTNYTGDLTGASFVTMTVVSGVPVPEPGILVAALGGLGMLAVLRRRRLR